MKVKSIIKFCAEALCLGFAIVGVLFTIQHTTGWHIFRRSHKPHINYHCGCDREIRAVSFYKGPFNTPLESPTKLNDWEMHAIWYFAHKIVTGCYPHDLDVEHFSPERMLLLQCIDADQAIYNAARIAYCELRPKLRAAGNGVWERWCVEMKLAATHTPYLCPADRIDPIDYYAQWYQQKVQKERQL